ncbi:MAG: DMT family transporter [Salinisphaera sp.]|jgi:drug/metabolite transporter (DMT)-like permease|nr:DMT family transporter [Salinisphaera sp.]
MSGRNKNALALGYALICVLLWSFIPVFSRLSESSLDHLQYLFWSNVLSVFAVGCVFIFPRARREIAAVGHWGLFLCQASLIGVLDGLYYALLYYGFNHENAYVIAVAQYSWPILLAVLAAIVLYERPGADKILAIALGFSGLVVTVTRGHILSLEISNPLAVGATLIGAFSFALLSMLSKKFALPASLGSLFLFVASTIFSAVLVSAFSGFGWPGASALPGVIINGAFINGLSYILWIKALASGDSTSVAAMVFLTPVLSGLWVYIVFAEPFYPAYGVGMLLAVLGGLLATGLIGLPRRRKNVGP